MIRHTAVALALMTVPTAANAQFVQEYDTRPVITRQPLALSQAQRTTIYRTIIPQGRGRAPIVRERIVTEPVAPAPMLRERVVGPVDAYAYGALDAYAYGDVAPRRRWVVEPDAYTANAYAIGTRVPVGTRLVPLPPAAVAQVPTVRDYRYVTVAGRVLLIDPDTGVVVADVTP
jgi:hypothetical protein